MLYLSGVVRPGLPAMVTPRMGQRPPEGMVWAADNGRFAAPQDYSDDTYLAWLERIGPDRCLLATAPDVVGDAVATLDMSLPMLSRIRALGFPAAIVTQDGLTPDMVPWDDIDAIFIGGTDTHKLGPEAHVLAVEAKQRGKWVHMGRVNSWRRFDYARSIGCDSADGTFIKYGPDINESKVRGWMARAAREPHIWAHLAEEKE